MKRFSLQLIDFQENDGHQRKMAALVNPLSEERLVRITRDFVCKFLPARQQKCKGFGCSSMIFQKMAAILIFLSVQ